MRIGRYILALALTAAAIGAAPASADAAAEAHASKPAYDAGSLELIGSGSFRTDTRHSQLRVTVCLRKRFGRVSFTVRCSTATGSGRRVKESVSVPGCVKGVWRTTVTGEALGRNGNWTDQASAVSRRFRC
jgi:hypothetical protein